MKRNWTAGISGVLFITLMQGQGPVVVTDTVHYFYNKHYFKTAATLQNFPDFLVPAATGTAITYLGNIFDNNEPIAIYGLEAFARFRNGTFLPTIPVHGGLYLCDIGTNSLPMLPPLDSVRFFVGLSTPTGIAVGGALTKTHTINGPYAVLLRNMSTKLGDTLLLKMTGAMTATSNAAAVRKISDSKGVLCHNGQFFSATDFNGPGFGPGTDYEFCIAPHVQYTLQAGQAKPADTIICPFDQVTYTNTSSWRLTSRYYNLIEFRRTWDQNPAFHPQAFPTWPIVPLQRGVNWILNPSGLESFSYTPSGNGALTFTAQPPQNTVVCHPGSEFRVFMQGMNIRGGLPKFLYNGEFNICAKYCPGAGLLNEGYTVGVSVYPNPCEGMIRFEGLEGAAILQVSDLSGRIILRTAVVNDEWIDLGDLPAGAYVLRMHLPAATTVMKLLRL